jgi:iron complex outermembrane recepter protein
MRITSTVASALALVLFSEAASAQTATTPAPTAAPATPAQDAAPAPDEAARASDALLGEIVVTANKKANAESLQRVAASITAFGQSQLEALQFRSIESLTYAVPNVQLDQLGSLKGVANFTIRGLGVNSSTPSVEPAVGTFIDGVYLGTNYGVVVDTFDVESIEVLRGPQGVLFGRNVTGGAVSIRTARPNGNFGVHVRANVETRGNQIYAGSIEGTLAPDVLFGKVTGYWNHDPGYFWNPTLGRHIGKNDTWFIRPTLVFKPSSNFTTTLIGEHLKLTGDGPAGANPKFAKPFQSTINDAGLSYLRENSLTSDSELEVGPGDGKIVNIANYREIKQRNRFDLDGQQADVSIVYNYFKQHQLSDELRYAARLWDTVDFVTGLYYFSQEQLYIERDVNKPLATPIIEGGARLKQNSWGVFANADISLTDELILGVGGRYSHDRKKFGIAYRAAPPSPCTIAAETCTSYPSFNDAKNFSSFTPKVVLRYQFTPETQVFGLYTKGYRSGGYNLKAQSAGAAAAFNDEKADDFEIGFKTTLFNRALRLNVTAFHNTLHDLQKQGTFNLPTGPLSLVGNGADAKIKGLEGELTLRAAKGLTFTGSLGITDGKYTKVTADLNGDGAINAKDLALKLPRLSPVTWGVGGYYDTDIAGLGTFGTQVTYNYRRKSWFNEPNTGLLPTFHDLAANISLSPEGYKSMKVTLYAKNLLNDENTGNNSPLPAFQGGGAITFPTKGRVFGAELDLRF